ncbi:MAG: RagB/SusD family nutrient uptake outer membrane protein, partial [Prolixibacteraceae bacterium]|nr:RagB/SusD family nutrient uptake outer membrane protein [Prolixibacteraceae bacterium]
TINKVRGRAAVNLPPVTETNPAELREIVRNERRIEFSQEEFIRWWDLRRWGIFVESVNRKFYGLKLTDDPENYTEYTVETVGKYRGHKIVLDKTGSIDSKYELLPIPIYEININPSLEQNPGY